MRIKAQITTHMLGGDDPESVERLKVLHEDEIARANGATPQHNNGLPPRDVPAGVDEDETLAW
jgi:hypothetical protein